MRSSNKRDIIISELEVLAQNEAINGNSFKVRAYKKVISQLKSLESIKSMDDLQNVSGIGIKIRAKIIEILESGKLRAAQSIKRDKSSKLELYNTLLKIHGVGMVKAKSLVKMGIDSIKSLEKAVKKDHSILNTTQKKGLQYYTDIQLRIPRSEMILHNKKLVSLTKYIDPDLDLEIVGSFRRGEKNSGDIDVLLTVYRKISEQKRTSIFKKVIKVLKESDYIVEDLSSGKTKYLGICKMNKSKPARRIDILITSQEEYPFALMYFSGDATLNVELRKAAIDQGLRLNEYGLTNVKTKKKIKLESEKEIFEYLGFKYIPPKKRSGAKLKKLK
jgi:DNA polymerase/3'-5' exonuclease PolX